MKTTILIADDHQVVAEGIAQIIEKSSIAEVKAITHTLDETILKVELLQPDILLLDISMPDGDGIEAVPSITKVCPTIRIIMLTYFAEAAVIQRSMKAGAWGYLLKSTNAEELLQGIQTVAEGKHYICEEAKTISASSKETLPTLTIREREILRLVVEGYTMKEIASKLYLSFETVHSYMKYIRQKLGCNNIASLVRTAIEKHLING